MLIRQSKIPETSIFGEGEQEKCIDTLATANYNTYEQLFICLIEEVMCYVRERIKRIS